MQLITVYLTLRYNRRVQCFQQYGCCLYLCSLTEFDIWCCCASKNSSTSKTWSWMQGCRPYVTMVKKSWNALKKILKVKKSTFLFFCTEMFFTKKISWNQDKPWKLTSLWMLWWLNRWQFINFNDTLREAHPTIYQCPWEKVVFVGIHGGAKVLCSVF